MIEDAELSRLSSLVSLFITCAEKGGTIELVRVQRIVSEELNTLLTELEERKTKQENEDGA